MSLTKNRFDNNPYTSLRNRRLSDLVEDMSKSRATTPFVQGSSVSNTPYKSPWVTTTVCKTPEELEAERIARAEKARQEAESKIVVAKMQEEMAAQLCSYHADVESVRESQKPFKYLLTRKGVMRIMTTPLGNFKAIIKTDVPGAINVAEGLEFALPKIPAHDLQVVVSFFKEVMRTKRNSEALIQWYWDTENKKYLMWCPDQTVGAASVHFKRDENMDEKYVLVLDIHSH